LIERALSLNEQNNNGDAGHKDLHTTHQHVHRAVLTLSHNSKNKDRSRKTDEGNHDHRNDTRPRPALPHIAMENEEPAARKCERCADKPGPQARDPRTTNQEGAEHGEDQTCCSERSQYQDEGRSNGGFAFCAVHRIWLTTLRLIGRDPHAARARSVAAAS
jgi:hypothetical protein